MAENIGRFLEGIAESMVRTEIILFFHRNQFAMDVARNIARWIGRDVAVVEKELVGLVEQKILDRMGTGPSAIYSYTQDVETIETIDKFVTELTLGREKVRRAMEGLKPSL
ncbi:MAG: hypothetical protein AB1630_01375 [bacterium]